MATAINNHHHPHAAPQHYSRGNSSSSTTSNGASATHTSSNNSAQSHQSLNAPTSVARRGLSSPPSLLNARIFARLTAGYAQEQKMAELRAAYASPPTAYSSAASANATPNGRRNAGPSRASLPFVATTNAANTAILPTSATTAVDLFMENGGGQKSGLSSTSSSRRGSAVANCLPTPSLMDLAASAGLLSLSPSDLVFESSVLGIAYYDFILSVSEVTSNGGNNVFGGGGTSFSSSSCSSTTTIKENPATKMETSPGGKRRVRPTGSEPTPTMSAREPEKGGPAAMLFKLDKQRPGTSMGINNERKGSTQTTHSATTENTTSVPTVKIASDAEINNQQNSNTSSTFSNCNYRLFLAKLDSHTNVEWFESVIVPGELLERNAIPVNELSLLTMGILIWRSRLTNSRLLCLANGQLGEDSTTALEALKRAANKYKCMHHVLTIGQRRQSASSTHSSCSTSSYRSSSSCGSYGQSQDSGMKLRVLMCQSRNELSAVPSQALRDAKFLMAPTTNPLLCLCFPLT